MYIWHWVSDYHVSGCAILHSWLHSAINSCIPLRIHCSARLIYISLLGYTVVRRIQKKQGHPDLTVVLHAFRATREIFTDVWLHKQMIIHAYSNRYLATLNHVKKLVRPCCTTTSTVANNKYMHLIKRFAYCLWSTCQKRNWSSRQDYLLVDMHISVACRFVQFRPKYGGHNIRNCSCWKNAAGLLCLLCNLFRARIFFNLK